MYAWRMRNRLHQRHVHTQPAKCPPHVGFKPSPFSDAPVGSHTREETDPLAPPTRASTHINPSLLLLTNGPLLVPQVTLLTNGTRLKSTRLEALEQTLAAEQARHSQEASCLEEQLQQAQAARATAQSEALAASRDSEEARRVVAESAGARGRAEASLQQLQQQHEALVAEHAVLKQQVRVVWPLGAGGVWRCWALVRVGCCCWCNLEGDFCVHASSHMAAAVCHQQLS